MGSDDDSTAEASEASAEDEDGSRFEMETIQMAEGSPEEVDDGITRMVEPEDED